MTTERQAVIDSPVWPFLEIDSDERLLAFEARFGEVAGDVMVAGRNLRGLWNLYYWLRRVEHGDMTARELRSKLASVLRDSRKAKKPYPEGDEGAFLMRVTQDLARLLGQGMGGYTVSAVAPGRIALRRAPRTLLERMHGDLFSAMATRMEAGECDAADCSIVFLRSDPRQRYCGTTCKNREAQRARRSRPVPTS